MRVSVWVRKIIQVAMFYKTRIKSASRTLRVAPNKCPLKILPQPPGGGTWVCFGWVCASQDSKLAPRSKKEFPLKLIPSSRNGPTFYTPF